MENQKSYLKVDICDSDGTFITIFYVVESGLFEPIKVIERLDVHLYQFIENVSLGWRGAS